MRIRQDGSVQSSSTPTFQNAGRKEDFALYRCMITDVIYTDDPDNITANAANPRVLYNVVVIGGFATGQKISNCRLSSDLGGNSSFWERTLRASSFDISQTALEDCDGDIVLVQFNQGHTGSPVIVGLDQGIDTADFIGATMEEGPRSLRQYNGVQETINNDGELELQVKGGEATPEDGSFEPNEEPLFTYKVSKDEAVTMVFKSGLKVSYDGQNDSVSIETNGGTKTLIDGQNDLVSMETKGGAKATVDGNADDIKLVAKGSAELHLSDDKVALGASSAELLDQISQALDKHIQFLNQTDALHTHIGNLGYPTLLPVETAQFIQLATDLQVIKGKIDGIKGTL